MAVEKWNSTTFNYVGHVDWPGFVDHVGNDLTLELTLEHAPLV
jgi:hypothetical protein